MPLLNAPPFAVFPAPAGINRRKSPPVSSLISVPRASGDKPEKKLLS
ncbi:TPA: hypothetical protein HIO09_002089 [Escherichia coli]|nr:hypothetical protein [Escherichia coli]EFG8647920.1 hypothetical protein [Escherichia coli]EFM5695050.1 hypothetical protein [Escherichia coli]HAI0343065.1 hypothetical protein [Escherichia coli]HAM9169023.1 hypothetical protein [Escherichia coli]